METTTTLMLEINFAFTIGLSRYLRGHYEHIPVQS